MNQLQLFGMEGKAEQSGWSKDKRPPNISVSKVFSANHKWRECKIIGKNISIRSYSAACTFRSKFYLYGGYQILSGSLADFYSISLDDNEPTFNWQQIFPRTPTTPGARSKHALIAAAQRIYLVGGLLANNDSSSDIYEFDPATLEWTLKKPQGATLPPIESFGAVLVGSGEEERIIIAFGFNEERAEHSNAVYQYNIAKNRLVVLFEGSENGSAEVPQPRIGCPLATDGSNVYAFGGKDENHRFNDIWSFNLTDYKFRRLPDEGEVPAIRNGHTINYYDGKLYVFGGIHDITWELDDLHIYVLKTHRWTTLEQDSPRKLDKKLIQEHQTSLKDRADKNSSGSRKKNWFDTVSAGLGRQQLSPSSATRKNFTISLNEQNRGESPGKMLNEQRKKVFFQKKAEMLRNFEISQEERGRLVILETSSQAMKNSLDVIGNPDARPPLDDRLTDFGKESVSKFLEPLRNNSNIVVGKKPCARDGHCALVLGEELVVFGGDRHQMSFNDIYKLDLRLAQG